MNALKFGLIIGLACITACSKQDQNVEQIIIDLKKNKVASIEQLPIIKDYEAPTYTPVKLNDPFSEPIMKIVINNNQATSKPLVPMKPQIKRPDYDRPREQLENYTLDSLSMVGTLRRKGEIWALILDRAGILHKVKVGNYLGQNSGKIRKITDAGIDLEEIISDQDGGWITRSARIVMQN